MLQVRPMYIPALQLGFSRLLRMAYLRHNFWWSVGYCCKPEGLAEASLLSSGSDNEEVMFLSCLLWPAQSLLSSEFRVEQDKSTSSLPGHPSDTPGRSCNANWFFCTKCEEPLLQLEMPSLRWQFAQHPHAPPHWLAGALFPGPSLALSLTPGQSGQKRLHSGRWDEHPHSHPAQDWS